MTFDEFIVKWDGKLCDFDLAFSGQCVDLARMYIKEVCRTKQFSPVVGAKDIWKQELEGFDKITNTPEGIPSKGSIVIWGSDYGPFGHVAISLGGTTSTFQAFSQNDPVGSLCKVRQYRSYRTVLGWFTPKSIIEEQMPEDIRLQLLNENGLKTEGQLRDAISHHQGWDSLQKDLTNTKNELEQTKVSLDAMAKAKEDTITELKKVELEAKLWKEKHETFIATVAKALGTTQDEARIIPEIDSLIAKSEKLEDIVDERPIISASPIHKLLEEILSYLKKLVVKKEKNGN